ncbi:hypothetical protein A9986_15110 [Solibacillus silvestris]|nr:prepilin-type N-terminal cleavage/methylation domain-containing protein [Solibacillus silvestris]OBW53499.1 hypothetical protein A9986_15110 [Solibacillus silvestris]
MFNTLKKRIKNEKGLSLVELLAVIVILAIVAAIAIPAIGNIIANSEAKAEIADATQILNASNIYFTDNPTADTFKPADSAWNDYVESGGKITVSEVKRVEGSGNTITFKGKRITSDVTRTLDELNKATVSKGEVQWAGTGTGTGTETGTDSTGN